MRLSLRPWGEVLSPPFCVRGGSLAHRCPGGGQRHGGHSAHLAGFPRAPRAPHRVPCALPSGGAGLPGCDALGPGAQA